MNLALLSSFISKFSASQWEFNQLLHTPAPSYPISTGKTGIAAERRAAKKRRNVKRRG